MTTVQELDLELTFTGATSVVRFDDDAYHGASTAQRVDFIAEYEGRDIFVEIVNGGVKVGHWAAQNQAG